MSAPRLAAAAALLAALAACAGPGSDAGSGARAVRASGAPAPVGPYAQAVRRGPAVWLSGQVGLDPATGALVPGGVASEARRALANLGAVLAEAGLARDDVVRAEVYLVDVADYAAVNAEYAAFFGDHAPARTCVAVAALPAGARVEIAFTAVAGR